MLYLILQFLFCLPVMSHDEYPDLRVVCFGCSSGIGKAAAEILLQGGAHVVIASRSPHKAKDLLDRFPTTSAGIKADAGEPAQIYALAAEAKKFFGKPTTGLIYAPTGMGMGVLRVHGGKATAEALQEQLSINVFGLSYFVDAFKDDLIATSATTRNLGSVVAVSSVVSEQPIFGMTPYSTAKAAQDGLIKSLALEFGAVGVRFNSILPAAIRTAVVEDMLGGGASADAFFVDAGWRHLLGRHGYPDECGHIMAFLVSQRASFMTGEQIRVDGGQGILSSLADSFSGMATPNEDNWFPLSRKWSLAAKAQKKKEL